MYAGRTTIFQNFFFIFKQAKFFKDRIIVYTPDYAASCTRRQTSSTLFIMQIGNNSQNSGGASVRIDLETKKNTRFSKKCLYSSVFNHELLNHYTMRCIGKYLLFIKAEIETPFFIRANTQKCTPERGRCCARRLSSCRYPRRRWPSRLCWPTWRCSSRFTASLAVLASQLTSFTSLQATIQASVACLAGFARRWSLKNKNAGNRQRS